MTYFPSLSITQNVIADADNSNDNATQIVAAATWNSAGTGTSTLGVAGIQVSVKTDSNLEIYIDQSPNGTNWDITDTIKYYHTLGGSGWTIQAVSSYVRVRAKNVGSADTTYIRLQTALCPIVEAVPRTLDDQGNLQVGIKSFSGYLGSQVEISPQGNLRTVEPTRLVGASFSGTAALDSNFWSTTGSTGTGGAGGTVTAGELVLTTGTTANATGRVTSVRYARYSAGASNFVRMVVDLPAVTGANVRNFGAFDANDGFFFVDDFSDGANHVLKMVCRKGGSDTNTIASGAFNGSNGSTYAIGTSTGATLATTFEIYLANKKVYFVIDDALIHTFTASSTSLSSTLSLPLRFESINSGSNNNANLLNVRVASINRLGPLVTDSIYKNIVGATGAAGTVLKTSGGRLKRIIIGNLPVTNNTITIYDNVSAAAPAIGIITESQASNNTSNLPVSLEYDCPFFTGLTIVTVGANTNITVVYE